MRLIDADATIKYLREFRCKDCNRRKGMKNGKIRFCYEIGDAPCRACDIGDTIDYFLDEDISPTVDAVILKEQEWHIFHENEDGVMDVECIPNNGEEFLLYRKHLGDMIVAPWGDDDWAEYACTADGEPFEDGDAWMELPKPPKQ